MAARKRTTKRVSSSTRGSRKKTSTKRSSAKTTSKKKATPKRSTKTTKRSAKKTSTKRKTTTTTRQPPTTRGRSSRQQYTPTTSRRTSHRMAEIEQAPPISRETEEKFTMLMEQMRQMQEQNLALVRQMTGNQRQEVAPAPTAEVPGDESKESMMNKVKELLAHQKKSGTTTLAQEKEYIEKRAPTPKLKQEEKLEEREKFVFQDEDEYEQQPELKSTAPVVLTKKEEESFQSTTKTRGMLTLEEAQVYAELLQDLQDEVNKVFIGQEHIVRSVVMSLVCDAHTLLEGVPGLAKSLLIEVLGQTVGGTSFERIQFLPDLLPADIIGGQIFNPKTSEFVTHKGPIFANFVLADEINRAPPKTHAAVMEAMQEKKINIANEEFILDRPFLVLATQNPLENKGTYALPEAVLDRFMFKVILDYPKRSDEMKIITENATTKKIKQGVKIILNKEKLLEIQQKVKTVYISPKIREYILDLIEATRGVNQEIQGTKFLKYGAGVRASIYLGVGAKANALLSGRNYVLPDDVYAVVPDIFRHRLSLNYRGKAHNISSEKVIEEILSKVNPL